MKAISIVALVIGVLMLGSAGLAAFGLVLGIAIKLAIGGALTYGGYKGIQAGSMDNLLAYKKRKELGL